MFYVMLPLLSWSSDVRCFYEDSLERLIVVTLGNITD